MPPLLLTGGTGYIGSHTAVCLIEAGYEVVLLDNLCNSGVQVLQQIKRITGVEPVFVEADLRQRQSLQRVFEQFDFDAVIHFAGLKAAGESKQLPLEYFHNNVAGTLELLQLMQQYQVKRLVFSSSATVYGDHAHLPLTEDSDTRPVNPYGHSKLMIEHILQQMASAYKDWAITALRYFNPVGAHYSGLIGESPKGIPNNLMPYICQVASGDLPLVQVFGDDYDTVDGTGVRDYVHVDDLARGHLLALEKLTINDKVSVYNLGVGKGYSVMQILQTFMQVNNIQVPYQVTQRRCGDSASCYADCQLAREQLGWQAEKSLEQICVDAWRWQQFYSKNR